MGDEVLDAARYITMVEDRAAGADALDAVGAAAQVQRELGDAADQVLERFVCAARRAGHSWTAMGNRLGVSKQAARQRFTDPSVGSAVTWRWTGWASPASGCGTPSSACSGPATPRTDLLVLPEGQAQRTRGGRTGRLHLRGLTPPGRQRTLHAPSSLVARQGHHVGCEALQPTMCSPRPSTATRQNALRCHADMASILAMLPRRRSVSGPPSAPGTSGPTTLRPRRVRPRQSF